MQLVDLTLHYTQVGLGGLAPGSGMGSCISGDVKPLRTWPRTLSGPHVLHCKRFSLADDETRLVLPSREVFGADV
jgi:hypothetical protein